MRYPKIVSIKNPKTDKLLKLRREFSKGARHKIKMPRWTGVQFTSSKQLEN